MYRSEIRPVTEITGDTTNRCCSKQNLVANLPGSGAQLPKVGHMICKQKLSYLDPIEIVQYRYLDYI